MRRGLNCTLSYVKDKKAVSYRLRARSVSSGFSMLAEESQGRDSKAFYPRQTAPDGFALMVELIGARERDSLNAYLMKYVEFLLNPDLAASAGPMTVRIPFLGFVREGIPISGYDFGTIVGEMVYSPTLVFEVSREPFDWDERPQVSAVKDILSGINSEESKYFYPTGVQLSGSQGSAQAVAAAVLTQAVEDIDAAIDGLF